MSFKIPKNLADLKGLGFHPLLPVELNDVDVDRMMTHLFEMCVNSGYIKASKTHVDQFDDYLDVLTKRTRSEGLTGEARREALEGWIKEAVVKMGRAGKDRSTAKMDYAYPITVGSFRSGLPKSRNRNRQADVLIYGSMYQEAVRRGGQAGAAMDLARQFGGAFGTGLELSGNLSEPQYDGNSDIDISALLALRFFECFEERGGGTQVKKQQEVAVPGAVDPIGRDALNLITLYGPRMPATEGTNHLAGLLSVRLFQLPLRTALAARHLLETGDLADDMLLSTASNPLQIYCDFTMSRGSASDELARRCVQRDLEVMRQFFTDRLVLRSLYLAGPVMDPQKFEEMKQQSIATCLQWLVRSLETDEMKMALRMQVQTIEMSFGTDPEGLDGKQFIQELRSNGFDSLDLVSRVLVEGLHQRGLENQVKWFWSTGGVMKSFGLLRGTLRARTSWRYCPSDELLVSMLLSCFSEETGARTQSEMGIPELLDRLENRFGILIARPPDSMNSSEARSGAAANRSAFMRRLQLLGCFDGLSDDFSAQHVRRPRGAVA